MKHTTSIKLIMLGTVIVCAVSLLGGAVYAAFVDKSKVTGSTFSVGSADLKLLRNLAGGVSSDNLTDEVEGPSFSNISPQWQADYLVKIFNNTPTTLRLISNANYSTANDPSDLRSVIFVEVFDWEDLNNDGNVDHLELGASYGKKTIVKWKTEGIDLAELLPGNTKAFILRFSTDTLSDSKQGATGVFDFEFSASSNSI